MAPYIFPHFPWNFWLLSSLFFLSILFIRNKSRKAWKLPPGPIHIPIIGDLHRIQFDMPHRSFWVLSKKYGPLMQLQLGPKPAVVVSSAKMAKAALKFHDAEFSRRPALISGNPLSYNFLDVAFNPHHDVYAKDMRKLLVSQLLNATTVHSFRSIREEEVAQLITSVFHSSSTLSSSSEPVDLKAMLLTLSNNIACTIAFSKSYEKSQMHRLLEEGIHMLSSYFIADFFPWLWWIDVITGSYAKLRRTFKDLDDFYEQIIQEHIDPMRREPKHNDFVDHLLQVQRDQHLTRDHVKAMIMNVLFGTTDTVAVVITWAIAELMRSPSSMRKCQEEVRTAVGSKGMVNESDLHQLHYLKSVVKESMRLHPPAPLSLPRETAQHCEINGHDILPNTTLIVNVWAISRDPESWEKPEEFLPERFMDNSIDYKGQDFEFIPFGSGRRGCPGMHFAIPTIELALANLLYSFDWALPVGMSKEDMDMTETFGFLPYPKCGLFLVPTKHDNISTPKMQFGNPPDAAVYHQQNHDPCQGSMH